MPFCPTCRYEYSAETFKCPDCDQWLVAQLPPEEEGASDNDGPEEFDWVPLALITSDLSADMLVEVLHDKDIPAVVLSGGGFFGRTGQMGLTSFNAAGVGFIVAVPKEYIEAADTEGAGILGEDWPKVRLADVS